MAAIVGALRAVLSLESASFMSGLNASQKALAGFDKRVKAIGGKMQAVGAALSIAGGGILAAVKTQVNAADELSKAAQKFGIPIEQLSRLNHAAGLSDLSLESLGQSVGRFSRVIADTPDKVTGLGVAVADADGQMRGADAILTDLAGVFAAMPDGVEKTALAMELFGRAGLEMIPLLNGGAQSLRDLANEADALGITLTADVGKAAEEFNDGITRLGAGIQGLVRDVMVELLPVLQQVVDRLRDGVAWFRDISPPIREFAAKLAIVTVVAGPLIIALGTVVSSLGLVAAALTTLTALAIANPIVAAITAIAVGAALIYANWDGIKAFFVDLWESVSTAASDAWTTVKTKWSEVTGYFSNLLTVELPKIFTDAWDGIKALFAQWVADLEEVGREIVEGLKRGILERWDAMVGWFKDKADGLAGSIRGVFGIESPSKVFREIGSFITEGLAVGIKDNVPMVDEAMSGLEGAVGPDGLEKSANHTRDAFKGLFRDIVSGSSSAREALSTLLSGFADRLSSSAFDALWGTLFPNKDGNVFSGGRIQAFASGGVVSQPTAFRMPRGIGLMGEAGPEAVMPLTRVGGKLGVRAAGGGGVTINIDARGAQEGVAAQIRRELQAFAPRIVDASVSAVSNARLRGKAV